MQNVLNNFRICEKKNVEMSLKKILDIPPSL